jgi:hypothetical protein
MMEQGDTGKTHMSRIIPLEEGLQPLVGAFNRAAHLPKFLALTSPT